MCCVTVKQFGRVTAYAATRPNCLITKYINWHQYCNISEAQTRKLPDDGLVKPKHVGAFIVYFNINFNILKQIGCALVGLIKKLDNIRMHGTTVKKNKKSSFVL